MKEKIKIGFSLEEEVARKMNKKQYKESMSWIRKMNRHMTDRINKAGIGHELTV